jgi:hypothetical protein
MNKRVFARTHFSDTKKKENEMNNRRYRRQMNINVRRLRTYRRSSTVDVYISSVVDQPRLMIRTVRSYYYNDEIYW